MERENDLLKQRIQALEKTIDSSREELIQTRNRAVTSTDDAKRLNHELSSSVSEFEVFKETMAKLLSNHHFEIDSTEESIKNRIKELVANEREYKMKTDSLNGTVAELSKQLEQQCEIYHDTIRRAKSAETSTYQHESKLRDLENELISGNILQDTLRNEKNKYMQFLQQMSDAMGMTSMCLDVGYDMNTDSLIARARQLAKLESDALVQKTSTNHNLHKKMKLLKEQLQSKELHIELLRKKIAQQDEKEHTRSALAIDRDDAIITVQKLQKKVERLQHALGDERVKVTQLKAQLADTNQLKIVTLDQRKKIDDLSTYVDKLSTTKDRQRQKLSCLKKELKMTENDAGEHSSTLKMQLNALTNDLKSNKSLLDEVNRREKQLVDFREVVARMLGLDVTSLAIPDYEIISRLEKLIRNHHIGAAAGAGLDRSLELMNQRFAAGYENEINPVYHPQPPLTRSRTASPRKHRHHRSRSISPVRY
uniref:Coiled-coil domain-containing protein 170 n=1 Tax=Phallusia mammillata TaxID=59560 RepID=A0A6F9D9A8_9ASCI|nr:coiled-coil domain-containing protein 170 [Phallusia mammillata]